MLRLDVVLHLKTWLQNTAGLCPDIFSILWCNLIFIITVCYSMILRDWVMFTYLFQPVLCSSNSIVRCSPHLMCLRCLYRLMLNIQCYVLVFVAGWSLTLSFAVFIIVIVVRILDICNLLPPSTAIFCLPEMWLLFMLSYIIFLFFLTVNQAVRWNLNWSI